MSYLPVHLTNKFSLIKLGKLYLSHRGNYCWPLIKSDRHTTHTPDKYIHIIPQHIPQHIALSSSVLERLDLEDDSSMLEPLCVPCSAQQQCVCGGGVMMMMMVVVGGVLPAWPYCSLHSCLSVSSGAVQWAEVRESTQEEKNHVVWRNVAAMASNERQDPTILNLTLMLTTVIPNVDYRACGIRHIPNKINVRFRIWVESCSWVASQAWVPPQVENSKLVG